MRAPDQVRFTETMSGWFAPDAAATHEAAEGIGRRVGTPGLFVLTVVTPDVDALIADPSHRAPVFGCVICPSLHPRPLAVDHGHLDLFVDAEPEGRVVHMRYGLRLRDEDGRTWFLRGIKEVVRRRGWPTVFADTTTLFVDIWSTGPMGRGGFPPATPPHAAPDGRPALRGILRMGAGGVLAQGLSFRGAGRWLGLRGIVRYLVYYVRRVLHVYLGPRSAPLRPTWSRTVPEVERDG